MAHTQNPIADQYWVKIWAGNREKEIEKTLAHKISGGKTKIILLAIIFLLIFSVPLPLPVEGVGRWISIIEYFGIASYQLDGVLRDVYPTVGQFLANGTFLFKWLGFGSAFALLYWVFFISPYNKLRSTDVPQYIQEVVYENPKSAMVFFKKSVQEQKYRWLGFLYGWCAGYLICSIWDYASWTAFIHMQSKWVNMLPSMLPLALIMLLVVNVVFMLVFGMVKPATRHGQRLRMFALIVIGACLLGTILLALLNANAVWDYVNNWELYSYRYPEDLTSTDPEIFINYNALFWTLGMIFSGVIALAFPIICNLYQNNKLRQVIDAKYHDVLLQAENCWEYAPLGEKHDKEVKLKAHIRRVAAGELAFFFGLFLVAMWGFYFYWGSQIDNETNEYIGIGIMAFEVIWFIFISPRYHYRLEKTVLYQGKSFGFVGTEDRGVGSWKKYWVAWDLKNKGKHPPEVVAKSKVWRRIIYFATAFLFLWICGLGMNEEAIIEFFNDSLDVPPYVTNGVFATLYIVIIPVLLAYALKVCRFPDLKDPDRGKKRIYSLVLFVVLAGLTIGIADVFNRFGPQIVDLYQAFSLDHLLGFVYAIGISVAFLFLHVVLVFPLFIRFEGLFEGAKDLIIALIFGIILISVWNFLCELLLTTPPLQWSLEGHSAEYLRDNLVLGLLLTHGAGYQYWAWIQQFLFVGYFAWLLYKATDNKWIIATCTSLLFGMFHWDNIPLMTITMIGGFLMGIWWGKYRNVYIFAILQGFNAAIVMRLVPMKMTVLAGAHD